jgi:hypothetical protein
MLLEKLGDIKEMILEQVKDFVITRIITAGITWLIGLLNPAAAFIKACKLIYDVIMFFVTNGSRIMAFVNTVIDSVTDIVKGNVSGVVEKIENVLGQMVPIIIGFLASVIGLGGIGQKIRQIVETLQKPVNKALDFIIKQGLKLAGPLIRGLTNLGSKAKAKAKAGIAWAKGKLRGGDDSPEGKQKRLDSGMRAGVAAANRFAGKKVGHQVLGPMLGLIGKRYGLAVLEPVQQGSNWAVHGEVQRMTAPTNVGVGGGGGGSFSHAPGGLAAHEGTTVLVGKKGPKTIHLLTQHGEAVTDAMLIDRLNEALRLFDVTRKDKVRAQQAVVNAMNVQLAELAKRPVSVKRDESIAKATRRRDEATALIAGYNAIDPKDRDAVFKTLDKWSSSLPHMVSQEVTRFTDNKVMEREATAAFAARKPAIDAAFTDPSGGSKPKGSTFVVTHPAPPGLGAGYELDKDNNAVPITAPLTKIVFRLILSDEAARHFMVETAYFER